MSTVVMEGEPRAQRVFAMLLPLMVLVFVGFLVIGMAMPVLPLHVHEGLGFGPVMVGIVAGCQFAAAVLARYWSGRTCDSRGPKRAVLIGLVGATAAGLLYLLSLALVGNPAASLSVLLAGRGVLGGAESFLITGATVWGLALAGPQNAGAVISWMGTAMFAAFAGGAPLGTMLYENGGFFAVSVAATLAPLATLALAASVRGTAPAGRRITGFLYVVRSIWMPGLAAALSSVGFGAIAAFAALLFASKGWTPVWLPFSAYAGALIGARLLFGRLPDRLGGARVAIVFVIIEAIGLALTGLSSTATLGALGAGLTGLGYALVFPAFGAEAVRLSPPEGRGLAMGAYTACLDVALGVSGPLLGLVASLAGLSAVFMTSVVVVACSAGVGLLLLRRQASVK